MSKYRIRRTSQFKADFKLALKRGFDPERLNFAVGLLAEGKPLPENFEDHALKGKLKGFRDCHITPDWILIYTIKNDVLVLTLAALGTHSDLF